MLPLLLLTTMQPLTAQTHKNLIINGDFSQGNSGFSSQYTFDQDLNPTGNYFIGGNPFECHHGGASFGDHTSGSGKMMIINGATDAGVSIWKQTVKVQPNRKYFFGAWAASWGQFGNPGTDPSPARLILCVNGKPIAPAFTLNSQDGAWTKYFASWKSGSAKSAELSIVDENLEGIGNDFAIDDLTFHD